MLEWFGFDLSTVCWNFFGWVNFCTPNIFATQQKHYTAEIFAEWFRRQKRPLLSGMAFQAGGVLWATIFSIPDSQLTMTKTVAVFYDGKILQKLNFPPNFSQFCRHKNPEIHLYINLCHFPFEMPSRMVATCWAPHEIGKLGSLA